MIISDCFALELDLGIRILSVRGMESIDSDLAARIRQDIIAGTYTDGERLSEAQLCATHSVSRTPVRLALRLLEREGIINRGEGRGYSVQNPTVEDIMKAVEVRGHLEGLAARLLAQSSNRFEHLPHMIKSTDQSEKRIDELERLGRLDESIIRQAHASNKDFHSGILTLCGNNFIEYTCKQISHLPMLAVGSMVFDRSVDENSDNFKRGIFRLRLGNAQHRVIIEAIESGDPVRAEGMMREHSHTMLDYIQTFEKRDGSLTVADLVAYSSTEPLKSAS